MSMKNHQVVTPEEWVEARKHLLAKEKEFTRLRDQLSHARRDLPWVRAKQYVFDGPEGKETLGQLFMATVSSSFIISCSLLIGRPAVRAARFGRTILTELCRILISAT
jgi:predicted dithiol-disulfide oxidoreductase (DUF899 family)